MLLLEIILVVSITLVILVLYYMAWNSINRSVNATKKFMNIEGPVMDLKDKMKKLAGRLNDLKDLGQDIGETIGNFMNTMGDVFEALNIITKIVDALCNVVKKIKDVGKSASDSVTGIFK